eukprot:jgi/Pico_ML_1/52561/g3248.t1
MPTTTRALLRAARATAATRADAAVRTAVSVEEGISLASEERKGALEEALRRLRASFGAGAVMRAGDAPLPRVSSVSTGSLLLDAALGVGGLPRGRVVEVFGPEASGKTTLALHHAAQVQKRGGTVAFVDAEHALDLHYAKQVGCNCDELLLSQPDSGEQALAVVDALVRSAGVDLVIVDSVAALVPQAELEGEVGDPHVAMQARLMSQALRKISHALAATECTLLFVNQVRNKIGGFGGFGAPQEITSGGKALKYYASVRLDIRRTGSMKQGDEVVGNFVKVKVAKNKMAPPFKTVELEIEFGKGISREAEMLDLGRKLRLLERNGSWWSKEGNNFAQGKDKAKAYLRDNPDFAAELEKKIRAGMPELSGLYNYKGDDDPEASASEG